MNLDDFRSLTKSVTAPLAAPSSDANLEGFILEMRARDQRERHRLTWMAVILLPGGMVFAAIGATARPGTGLIGLGIILVAAYMILKSRTFGRINYSVPAQEFLAAAAKRYQFWRAQDSPVALLLLTILGLGGALTVWRIALIYLSLRGARLALLGYLGFFLALIVFAWIVSRRKWQQENAVLLAEIRRRQQELSNGESPEPNS